MEPELTPAERLMIARAAYCIDPCPERKQAVADAEAALDKGLIAGTNAGADNGLTETGE